MTIRVVIAEDHRMVRELVAALLAREPDFTVVGEAGNGREAIDMVQKLRPDLLVLDVGLPEIDGIEVARRLRGSQPGLKLLALSIHSEERFVQAMLNAGANGYLLKTSAVTELVQAIRAVLQGKLYVSPEVARETQADELAGAAPASQSIPIGRRERQVLALLAEGKRSHEIASQLGISIATVEAHRRNIMRKLGLHTVAELTRYAVRKGLTAL
jgi:two-component system NarL family response regulator